MFSNLIKQQVYGDFEVVYAVIEYRNESDGDLATLGASVS